MINARAIVIKGNNIDTDVLYPGKYLNVLDPNQAREHLFEGLDPGIRELLKHGPTVLFVDDNFGSGSSREQPASAMRASGVQAVVGRSFARIFARNAVNCGMPAFVNPDAVRQVHQNDLVAIDLRTGLVRIAEVDFPSEERAALPVEITLAGGLVDWVRRRLEKDETS
jgi:3-isopropylmalate/(R)-2-methylmalate dehydratase small subunit